MPYAEECENPFYIEPVVLLKVKLAPSVACSSNAINSLIRGSVVTFAACAAAAAVYGGAVFVFGIVVLAALYGPSLYATWLGGAPEKPPKFGKEPPTQDQQKTGHEGFSSKSCGTRNAGYEGFRAELLSPPATTDQEVDVIGAAYQPLATSPTARNPFMNVLLDEIKYNPTRPPAEDINYPLVKTQLDDFYRTSFVSDPTDVFGRSSSQREWYTVPSTSIPNDQGSFADWLYRIPGKTCKEGGRSACVAENNSPLVSNWVGS